MVMPVMVSTNIDGVPGVEAIPCGRNGQFRLGGRPLTSPMVPSGVRPTNENRRPSIDCVRTVAVPAVARSYVWLVTGFQSPMALAAFPVPAARTLPFALIEWHAAVHCMAFPRVVVVGVLTSCASWPAGTRMMPPPPIATAEPR